MSSSQARRRLAQVGGAIAAAFVIAGCGNNYRPVVTPVTSSGPPAQITAYAVVVSAPSSGATVTIIDYSGDSIMVNQPLSQSIGVVPLAFTVDVTGSTGYSFNSDHTITNFPIVTTLQPKNELVTTLPSNSQPINIAAPSSGLWIGDLNGDVVNFFSGSPQTFKLAIPMEPATTPVFVAGAPTASGQRQYVINQNLGSTPTGVECNQAPTTVANDGTAVPVETSTNKADSPTIPVGKCPVFAVQSPDLQRLYVLNRGDDTITVINSQANRLNNDCPPPSGCLNQNHQTYFSHPTLPLSTNAVNTTGITPPNGTAGMTATAGPVYAEYNIATSQLVVANYDGGTISIIDVSLDQFGNDSPTFGTTYTVPVGTNPASVTVLFDGSRAYTANQADGTVTVVNLSSHTVTKTLNVVGHPRTVVSTQNSQTGKVYAASPDSTQLTIVQTTTDLIDTTVLVQGNVVDVRATTQSGGQGSGSISNPQYSSRIPGFGQPCNLPPAQLVAKFGSAYTLADCQAIP